MTVVSCQSLVVREAKAEARLAAKKVRAACDPALGEAMAAHVLRDRLPPPGAIIGGFWPLPGEIDTRFLLHALAERGYQITLPETPSRPGPLIFHTWRPGDVLTSSRFGTRHATGGIMQPDFILVPLLAFDAQGNRLGYGGGYYDRTLAGVPHAFRLGCAFSVQEVSQVPADAHDLKLHAVATERGTTSI